MSRLMSALSGVTYVVNSDTVGRARLVLARKVAEAMSGRYSGRASLAPTIRSSSTSISAKRPCAISPRCDGVAFDHRLPRSERGQITQAGLIRPAPHRAPRSPRVTVDAHRASRGRDTHEVRRIHFAEEGADSADTGRGAWSRGVPPARRPHTVASTVALGQWRDRPAYSQGELNHG